MNRIGCTRDATCVQLVHARSVLLGPAVLIVSIGVGLLHFGDDAPQGGVSPGSQPTAMAERNHLSTVHSPAEMLNGSDCVNVGPVTNEPTALPPGETLLLRASR